VSYALRPSSGITHNFIVASPAVDPALAVASKFSWNGEKQRSITCPLMPESTGYLTGNFIY